MEDHTIYKLTNQVTYILICIKTCLCLLCFILDFLILMFQISWFYICRLGANFTLEMHIRIVMSLLIALLTVADTKCNEISCVYLRNDNLFGCMILQQELKLLVMRRGIVLCKCFVSLWPTFCFFTFWPEMTFYSVNVEKMKTKIYRNSLLWTHAPHLLDSIVTKQI